MKDSEVIEIVDGELLYNLDAQEELSKYGIVVNILDRYIQFPNKEIISLALNLDKDSISQLGIESNKVYWNNNEVMSIVL